jgi:hypothetical protein
VFTPADAWLVAVYAAMLWLPGGVLGGAAGLRGWRLAAVAPLLTYAVVGLVGPWASMVGAPFTPAALALVVPGAGAAVLLRRHQARHDRAYRSAHRPDARPDDRSDGRRPAAPRPALWSLPANAAVAGCVLAAAAIGATAVMRGMGALTAIHQDWDAPFHANGIRGIAETGDGGLSAMHELLGYETAGFYPNAYHLLGAVVYRITGRGAPDVLNAHSLLIPGILALSLVALVRVMRGRAVLAGYTALLAVAATPATYDLIWRGPILPYATGIVLIPVAIVLVDDFLNGPSLRTGGLLALGLAGLLAIHSSALLGTILIALPYVLWRWWTEPGRLRREPALLALVAVAGALLTLPHLIGALRVGQATLAMDRPPELTPPAAIGALFTFEHSGPLEPIEPLPQWWLMAALAVGLISARRLGRLRWLIGSAALTALPFLAAAAYDSPRLDEMLRPWFDDRWRLGALCTVALLPLAGHGLAETQRLLAGACQRILGRAATNASTTNASTTNASTTNASAAKASVASVSVVTAVAVLLGFAALSGGFYLDRNQQRTAAMHHEHQTVSDLEAAAYRELANMVRPGELVMNDRGDGSVWIYALTGVRTVAGHFDPFGVNPDAELLGGRFNDYDTDPTVRAAAARLQVRYAIVGRGHLVAHWHRQPGMMRLDRVRALEKVYENPDAVIYRLR